MYHLPATTAIKKQLPKKAIYAKFDLKAAQREAFDAEVSRLDLVAVVSPQTIPAISAGEEISEVYVMLVTLRERDYSKNSVLLLHKLIKQNIIFALQFEGETQLAVYHTGQLLHTDWQPIIETEIPIEGLTMDAVWEGMVKAIGDIEVEEGRTLGEQIVQYNAQAELKAKIDALENRMYKERQPRKRKELFDELKKLREGLA